MGGKPCIRGMRVMVGNVVGLMVSGHTEGAILKAYPYLEPDDLKKHGPLRLAPTGRSLSAQGNALGHLFAKRKALKGRPNAAAT
jgi:hypothetical protein